MSMHKILKILVILSGTIIALAFVAVIGVQILFNTGLARRYIQDRINESIPGSITWEAQHLCIVKGQLSLDKARVMGTQNDTIIEADRLSIDVALPRLLDNELVIQQARLDRPGVFLEIDADGRLNLIRAFAAPTEKPEPQEAETETEGAGFNFRIGELMIEKGRFSFVLPATAKRAEARSLRLEDIGITIANGNWAARSARLDITIGGGDVDMAGMDTPIRGLFLSTVLADGRLDPLSLELKTPDSRLQLSGAAIDIFDKFKLDARLTLDAELSDIRRIFRLGTDLSGHAHIEIHGSGALENPDMTLNLEYGGGRLGGMPVREIFLESRMQDLQVAIDRLDADLPYGKFTSNGSVDLRAAFGDGILSAPTDLSAIAYRLDLAGTETQLSAFPGINHLSGVLVSVLHLEGRGISPGNLTVRANADIRGKGISVENALAPIDLQAAATAEMSGGVLKVEPLTVNTRDARLNIAGDYGLSDKRLNLTANAGIRELETLLAPLGISGIAGKSIDFSADISGPAAFPRIDARLQGARLAYRNFSIGGLSSSLKFTDGRMIIRSLNLKNGASQIALTGGIQLMDAQTRRPKADPGIDLDVIADPLRIQDFIPGLSGQLTIAGDIHGSLKHPAGNIDIDGRELDLGEQKIPAVDLTARLDGRKLIFDPLAVSLAEAQRIRAQGWVSLDQSYELNVESDPIAFSCIDRLADSDLSGKIELSADGKGTFTSPEIAGEVLVSEFSAGSRELPDLRINAALKDQEIRLDTADPFTIKARYDLSTRAFSAAANLVRTELSPLFQLAGRRDLSGEITGTLRATGNIGNLKGGQAQMRIADLHVLQKEIELIHATDVEAELENGRFKIPGSRVSLLKDGFMDIQGTGAMDGPLDISASGVLPAALFGTMVPGIGQPEGRLELSAQISGSLKQPRISGEIAFQSLGLTLIDTMQKLHNINGRIRITDQAVTVSGLKGGVDGGEFNLEGTVELNNYAPAKADLNFIAHALPVNISGLLEVQLNTDLKITGTPESASLSGSIVLLEGHYYKDINLSLVDRASEIGKRRRQTAPRTTAGGVDLPFANNLSLDVSLNSRNPFIVDNNLALLNIRPALRIHGTADNPLVTGRAQVTEGTITYRDTEFDVKKGVVDFVNPYRIEPTVDIRAESEVRQWVITLGVGGTPDDLDFKLSSSPPEDDADIISLLVVGKTTRELASGSGGSGRSPEEMLANLMAGKLAKQVKAETGLDIVEVEYRKNGSTEAEAADEVKVTVGKELSRRLTVKYGLERKSGIVVQQSTAIYKLLENLSVNAFNDTEGDFGGEVRYRLEFR